MLGDIPKGVTPKALGKGFSNLSLLYQVYWRPPNWTPEWKFLNLALCTTKWAFFTEIGDLIPWTTAPSRNEMQQFAPARCFLGLLNPTMVDMDVVDVASDMPREDLVAVEQLSSELGMRALDFRPGWVEQVVIRFQRPIILGHTHTHTCIYMSYRYICTDVYTPDTCMYIWWYLYTHTYSRRAKHILSVLLRHHTPWSFLVFDGFQWLIASIFGAKNVWVMVTSPMHYSACTQGFPDMDYFPWNLKCGDGHGDVSSNRDIPEAGCFLFTVDSNPWIRNTTRRREDVFLLPSSTQVVQIARCRCLSWRCWDLRLIP